MQPAAGAAHAEIARRRRRSRCRVREPRLLPSKQLGAQPHLPAERMWLSVQGQDERGAGVMMVQVGVMRGARRELRETVPTPQARDLLLLVLDCSLGQYARESSLVGDLQIAGAAHRRLR